MLKILKNNKKLLALLILFILLFSYNFLNPKNKKDLVKVSNDYLAKNLFKKGTFSNIEDVKITFNDGNIALVEVTGRSEVSPHPYIKVKLKAEKDSNNNWHIINKDEEPLTY